MPTGTITKLPAFFDFGLPKRPELVEAVAQLRAHKVVKYKRAKLRTHDLEFHLAPTEEQAENNQEGDLFRALIILRKDIGPAVWERINKLVEVTGGQRCCVYIITGKIPLDESHDDLIKFDEDLLKIKPGPIYCMPCRNLAEIGNGVMTMHRAYHILIDKVDRYDANPREAYKKFLHISAPNREFNDNQIDQLMGMAPTLMALMRMAETEEGQVALKRLLGSYPGARLVALLNRGRM